MKITRENSEWVGTCPSCFHDKIVGHPSKSPSFKVWKLDDGTWGYHCFGCDVSGNIFQFVQAFDQVSFTKAVETVLSEAGAPGWQDGQEQTDLSMPEDKPKEHVAFTLAQYQPAIAALECSRPAQEWLANRGITMETARQFCIGFVQSAEKITNRNNWLKDGWITFPTLSADRQMVRGQVPQHRRQESSD